MADLATDRAGLELGERPAWHRDAACRGIGPNVMFPIDGLGVVVAKAYCDRCPVREPCADVGLFEPDGVWGGNSERRRRQLRKLAGIRLTPRPDRIEDPTPDDAPDDQETDDL